MLYLGAVSYTHLDVYKRQIYSMTSGGPGNATETVMTVMMKKGISDGFYSVGSAFGVCFFIIVLIISGVTTKIMGKWGEAIS